MQKKSLFPNLDIERRMMPNEFIEWLGFIRFIEGKNISLTIADVQKKKGCLNHCRLYQCNFDNQVENYDKKWEMNSTKLKY